MRLTSLYAMQGGIITHRATSPFTTCYEDLPEDMDDWNCGQWDSYKDCNINKMGLSAAINQVNTDTDSISMFATGHDCRYQCDWVDRWENQGFDTGSNIFSKSYCSAQNVTEGVEGVTKTFAILTNPKFLIPIGLVIGAIFVYKNR